MGVGGPNAWYVVEKVSASNAGGYYVEVVGANGRSIRSTDPDVSGTVKPPAVLTVIPLGE